MIYLVKYSQVFALESDVRQNKYLVYVINKDSDMKLIQKFFYAPLIFACFISAAHADPLYNRFVGQYVSVNGGATIANKIFDPSDFERGFVGAGANIFAGSQINPYFAPELGLGYYSFASSGGATIFGLDGRFTIPAGSCVSLFFKLGAGYAEAITRFASRVQKNSFVPTLGAGIGFGFSPSSMVTVEGNGVWLPQSFGNANGFLGGLTLGVTHYWNS